MTVYRKPFPVARIPAGPRAPPAPAVNPWPLPERDRDMFEVEYRKAVNRAFRREEDQEVDPLEFWRDGEE